MELATPPACSSRVPKVRPRAIGISLNYLVVTRDGAGSSESVAGAGGCPSRRLSGASVLSSMAVAVKLRSYLGVLVLAGLVPLIVLTVAMTITLAHQQRTAVDRGLSNTVAALVAVVDNELETSIKSLQTLATSQRLDSDDLPAFYEHASRVRELHRWSTIGLIDSAGTHRLNVARPLGAVLPDLSDREYFKQVLASGRPYVSDLLRGRVTDTIDFAVAVPVVRHARVTYVLFAGVDSATFSRVFAAQRLPPQAVAFIMSRDSVYIARHPDHALFAGRPAPDAYVQQVRERPEGTFRGALADDVEMEAAYRASAHTGWTVAFGLPADSVNAGIRRVAWTGAAVGGGIVVAALALAALFARRMAAGIEALGVTASALGRGAAPERSERLHVRELEEMRGFLTDAYTLLREQGEAVRGEEAEREEARRRLAAIVDNSDDAIVSKDLDGIIMSWNPGAERIFGYGAEEAIGQPITIIIPPDRREEEEAVLRRLRHGERTDHFETVRWTKEGRLIDISLTVSPIRNAEGTVIGASKIARDITERRRAEADLKRLNETLEERVAERTRQLAEINAELDAFGYTVSHDLRAPLRAMDGFAKALAATYGDTIDARGQDFMRRIIGAAERMDDLIQDLLAYSRLSRDELRLEPVNLGDVVREALRDLEADIRARAASVTVTDPLGAVRAHRETLRQVVTNLVSNAIKFMAPDVVPQVRIHSESRGDMRRLCVHDNGIGIEPRYHANIFRVFERLHGVETYPGTGIGLAIVRRGTERMGGRLGLDSTPGEGTKFWIELPVAGRD
jgi:PAS domain S-box-containing protein